MDDASISDRVRSLRTRRGMTQEELAEAAGLSLAVIKKLEQGGTCRMETYHQLARALGVKTVWFVAPSSPEPREAAVDDTVLADMRSAITPPIGLSGKPLYGTADGDQPDLDRLRQAISSAAKKYHNDQYDELAAMMPGLIRSAHHHVDAYDTGDAHREALRLRADIVGLTGRYLIQIRAHDLALMALHASLRDALEIGDIPLAAAAVSSQAWAMLRQGRLDEVEQLCVQTADEVEPRMSRATPDELSGWGYLMLRAASAASRNNRYDEARQYAQLATTAGARLPYQHQDLAGHVAFGPLTPALMGPEIEMLADRPDRALELAQRIPRDVGAGNTSGWDRHRLDVARAHLRLGDADTATELMHTIRREHPLWLRYQQYARDITREILASRPRMPSPAMLELADFMGVEP
ncbi:MAG: helix-turn-helix transcriptional regulator [Micromonosporaceae bacterium]|nr:helix-turn-helix transcriptional regulator [Micromonosporaceae bacterium]